MGYPDTFKGYAVNSKDTWSDFHFLEYKPKRFEDYDIDIEITHYGVCASDLHTINGGWGDANGRFRDLEMKKQSSIERI